MVLRKFGRDLMNSSICRQTHWYENQSWSDFFDTSIPNVLLQNAISNGFNGGSFSKNANNLSSVGPLFTNRSMRTGTSLVRISHAVFECLKRMGSGTSADGSVVINVTNSSMISGRCMLKAKYHIYFKWINVNRICSWAMTKCQFSFTYNWVRFLFWSL